MKRIAFRTIMFVALASALLWSGQPIVQVMAAPPTPASPLIGAFVSETDTTHGFAILRPATWTAKNLGDWQSYYPVGSKGQPNRIVLGVTNLKTDSDALGPNQWLAQYELFLKSPSLSAWALGIEALWDRLKIRHSPGRHLGHAMIYVVNPSSDHTLVIAYVISQNTPLAVGLDGYGTFSDLGLLQSSGLLTDFDTMVTSMSVHTTSSALPATPSPTAPATVRPDTTGPWNSNSGWQWLANHSLEYYMEDTYYEAPPTVYYMYEWMYYTNYDIGTANLYAGAITDNPAQTCVYNNGYLVWRYINQTTTHSDGYLGDAYYPNVVVSHLNTTTAHLEIVGIMGQVYCSAYYFPFTH